MFHSIFNQDRFMLGLALAIAILLAPTLVSAQTVTGSLQGTVTDSGGAVVAGIDVVVRNVGMEPR